jgi:hypothetical protein
VKPGAPIPIGSKAIAPDLTYDFRMVKTPDHGPVISDEEYERRMFALYEGLPPIPSRHQEHDIRRRELDILIDHRLGSRFPEDRREALWVAHQNVDKRRIRTAIEAFSMSILPGGMRRATGRLAGSAAREYGKVLSQGELDQFLGTDRGQPPALPFDDAGPHKR